MLHVADRRRLSTLLGRVLDYLRSDRGFWLAFSWAAGTYSVLKALHFPNQWAATQAQVDYSHGVVKRGLFGEICRALHLPIDTSRGYAVVSFALMALFLIVLVRWVRRSGLLHRVGHGEAVCLFFGSYGFVYVVYLMGYLDIVLLIGAILTLGIRNSRARIVIAVVWAVIAAFIHEMYVVAFMPLTLVPILLDTGLETSPETSPDTQTSGAAQQPRLRAWLLVAASAAIPCAVVVALALRAPLSLRDARLLYAAASRRAAFPLDETFFVVLASSAADNARYLHSIMRVPRWWLNPAFDLVCFGPSAGFFLWLAWRMRKQWAASRTRTVVTGLLFFSALSPLLLNLAGVDVHRWSALAGINCFLAACTVSFHMPGSMSGPKPHIKLGSLSRKFVIVALFLSAGTEYGLFYGQLKAFPFAQYANTVYDAVRAHWI